MAAFIEQLERETSEDAVKSRGHINGLPIRPSCLLGDLTSDSKHPTEQPLPILYTLSQHHTEELSSLSAVTHRHLN